MATIHILPRLLQNQIAAGEVVERPFSVVKELVENSIDAGADQIEVTIRNGGKSFIQIRDNGSGMDPEDAALSLTRHATSKIHDTEDLFRIHTLGFRGEALAAISSVSHFTLETKKRGALVGTKIVTIGEEKKESEAVGLPDGTRMTIEKLFFNTPAREKYLKSDETEYSYIAKLLHEISLAYPGLSIKLTHNDKVTLDVRAGTLEERIGNILGKKFLQESVKIFVDRGDTKIEGYASAPGSCKSVKKHQYLIVNGRCVSDGLIAKAVRDAYHRVSEPGLFPEFVLALTIPEEAVDVNVHPRKLEVRFREPNEVFGLVKSTVGFTLTQFDQKRVRVDTPTLPFEEVQHFSKPSESISHTNHYSPTSHARSPYAAPSYRESHSQQRISDAISFSEALIGTSFENKLPSEIHEPSVPYSTTNGKKILGQLLRSYVLVESPEGLHIIDQHAAHERILFERLVEDFKTKEVQTQGLLTGELISLSKPELVLVELHKFFLEHLGFFMEPFGDNEVVVQSIPAILIHEIGNLPEIITNILHELSDLPVQTTFEVTNVVEKVFAYTACRSAIKFGDILEIREMEELLKDYEICPRRHTCPHGRNSQTLLDLATLKKFFDR